MMTSKPLLGVLSCFLAVLVAAFVFPVSAVSADNWTQIAKDGLGTPEHMQMLPGAVYEGRVYISANSFGAPIPSATWAYGPEGFRLSNGDGFGNPDNTMAYAFEVFEGSMYACTANFTAGAELWCLDDTTWSRVAAGGFGNPDNVMAFPMGTAGGKLVVGTVNYSTGCELFTFDGNAVKKIAAGGFGNPNNTDTSARVDSSAGRMLLATCNEADGLEVFSFDGTRLRKIAGGGIDDPDNIDCKVISYDPLEGAFYLGTTNFATGGEVWKYSGGKLSQVGSDGLGDPGNQAAYPFFTGGTVYVSTAWNGGAPPAGTGKVYKKTGENSFEKVAEDGFGDPNNIQCFAISSYDGYLYAGTVNMNGGQVWRSEVPPTLLEVSPVMTYGAAGAAIPAGSNVELAGFDFHNQRGEGKVLIDGHEAEVLSWSDSSITAEIPGAAEAGEARVVTSGGESNAVDFELTLPETWYFAEGTTRDNDTDGSYDTYLCIQNPNDSAVNVDVTFLKEGADVKVPTVGMAPDSRATINARDFLGSDVDASAVVEGSAPIVAERPMYFDYRNKWPGGHVVMGVPRPRDTWYFAEGTTRDDPEDGAFEEWLSILNPGREAAAVTVTYMLAEGEPVSSELTVGAGDRATVDVNLEVGAGQDVSIMVESSRPVVAERPMYFDYHSTWRGGHAISGVSEPDTLFYFAEGTTRDNPHDGSFQEWVCLQNPGDEDARVSLTYMLDPDGTRTQEIAVPAASRRTVDVAAFLGENVDSSLEVKSDRPIVAERPMYFSYRLMWDGGHDVAGCGAPRRNWFFAEGTTRDNPEDGVFHEYICIQNPGQKEATVVIDYLFGETGHGPDEMTIPARSRRTVNVAERVGINRDIAGVMISADANVVCERAIYFDYHMKWQGGHCSMGYGL
jgi:hypothetical protein